VFGLFGGCFLRFGFKKEGMLKVVHKIQAGEAQNPMHNYKIISSCLTNNMVYIYPARRTVLQNVQEMITVYSKDIKAL
jgi:hypothetical protein